MAGVPEVFSGAALAGLMDVAVHPEFRQNRWVYLSYSKPTPSRSTVALGREPGLGAAAILRIEPVE